MKTTFKLFLILFFAGCFSLLISGNGLQTKSKSKVLNPLKTQPESANPVTSYYQGMILLKVKQDIKIPFPQAGKVSFGIASLDAVAAEYNIKSLEKRFKQRSVPKNSGLPDLSRIYRVTFSDDLDVLEVAKHFDADPCIEYAEAVPINKVFEVPNDNMYDQLQHLLQIKAEAAWDIHKGENGTEEVIIGIVDTGIDWKHEDLSENSWQNMGEDLDGDGSTMVFDGSEWVLDPDDINGIDDDNNGYIDDLIGWDFYDWSLSGNGSDPGPFPTNPVFYHGTHVGGIAAGRTNNGIGISSISWNVKYLNVQAATNMNSVAFGYDGIIYAAEMGAHIINCSWGGSFFSQAYEEIIAYASGLGSIVVCAAGNDFEDLVFYPSGYPGSVSVASLSQNDIKSSYSNYSAAVDVAAPGGGLEGGILSTDPYDEYALRSGTSMASPLVAGLMALIRSYHPEWTSEEVIAQLIYTADNIDTINPYFEHKLGAGRINAFRALAMSNVQIPEELEFEVMTYDITDQDGNNKLEAGDTVTVDFSLRNFNSFVGCNQVSFELSSDDNCIQMITSVYQHDVDPDGKIIIEDAMKFVISSEATNHLTQIKLSINASIPITLGQEFILYLAIEPAGILVYDAFERQRDLSGKYIYEFLKQIGYDVTYSNDLPENLEGYESVFACFGNMGLNFDQGFYSIHDLTILRYYLIYGGNLFLESGAFFSGLNYLHPSFYATYCSYFGVQNSFVPISINPIVHLNGYSGSLMEGMQFNTSHQLYNYFIDALTANASGVPAFSEPGYGYVSIYRAGANHNAYFMGYSLGELEDEDKTSSRYNILLKILELFDNSAPEDYLIANFKAESRVGAAPLEVSFSDLSLSDENITITSRAWDFDNDGTIDSYDEYPVHTYNSPGKYTVSLIVSSDDQTDTIVMDDYVHVNQGILVYEKWEGQRNFSGTYVYNFLQEQGITSEYTTTYPISFLGYDAVFISQSVSNWLNSTTPDKLYQPLIEYLEAGGNVYLEGADALGWDLAFSPQLLPYFGLETADDGFYNPLEDLQGQANSLAEGLTFDASNQSIYGNQDLYTAMEGAVTVFLEDGEYPVAVQFDAGIYKTFCFSYALAELIDSETGSREALLSAILNFFDITISSDETPTTEVPFEAFLFPNPMSAQALLYIDLQADQNLEVDIYSIQGHKVKTIINDFHASGKYTYPMDATTLKSGSYYCIIKTEIGIQSIKLIKL